MTVRAASRRIILAYNTAQRVGRLYALDGAAQQAGGEEAAGTGGGGRVVSVSYVAGPGLFVSGTSGLVRVWRAADGQLLKTHARLCPSPITALAVNALGTRFAVGAEVGSSAEHSVASGAALRQLRGHAGAVCAILYLDQHLIVSAGWDGKVLFHAQGQGGQVLRSIGGHGSDITCLCASAPAATLLVGQVVCPACDSESCACDWRCHHNE